MSSLTTIEKQILKDIFKMDSGYVLDFRNKTFEELFRDVVGINIYDEKYSYYSESKAKRFIVSWEIENDIIVSKMLKELLKLLEFKGLSVTKPEYLSLKQIINRLLNHNEVITTDIDVSHIWSQDKIKLFISHRDNIKKEVKILASQLEFLGISSFIVHDTIQPMKTWKYEIYKGLQTMNAFLCFITKDFYESEWTNQKVGFALAKNMVLSKILLI